MKTQIEKEFVPYDVALTLRDLGFNEPCLGRYGTTSKKLFTDRVFKNSEELLEDGITFTNDLFAAPLYQQAFRWFREEFESYGRVQEKGTIANLEFIHIITGFNGFEQSNNYKSYEEAEIACLKELIKIVKENL